MMKIALIALAAVIAGKAAFADVVIAARNIRNNTIIAPSDLKLVASDFGGGFQSIQDVVGQETRVVLYAGRPISLNDIGPPALVERNQIVTLIYQTGPLSIETDGRSLGRAGIGDRIRVMNLNSRSTVVGTVNGYGTIVVSNSR